MRRPGEVRRAEIQPRPDQLVWHLGQRLGHTFRSADERVPSAFTFGEHGRVDIHLVDQAGHTFGIRGTWWADELGGLNVTGVDGGLADLRLRPNAAGHGYETEGDGPKQVFVRTEPKP